MRPILGHKLARRNVVLPVKGERRIDFHRLPAARTCLVVVEQQDLIAHFARTQVPGDGQLFAQANFAAFPIRGLGVGGALKRFQPLRQNAALGDGGAHYFPGAIGRLGHYGSRAQNFVFGRLLRACVRHGRNQQQKRQ